MGDTEDFNNCGCIKVGGFVFSTWNDGHLVKHIVQRAIAKRRHWDNELNLAAIIYAELVNQNPMAITSRVYNSDHSVKSIDLIRIKYPIIEVDYKKRLILQLDYEFDRNSKIETNVSKTWTFEEFINNDGQNKDKIDDRTISIINLIEKTFYNSVLN